MYRAATYSDRGAKKTTNQDALCFLSASTMYGDAVCAVICDGVGGLEEGEYASAVVVEAFARWFEREFPRYLHIEAGRAMLETDGIQEAWQAELERLNSLLADKGSASGSILGTTFTGMVLFGDDYVIGHVGDCRAYRCRHGVLDLLTQDQTLAMRELARGAISSEEARTHPQRNVLLQAVGSQEEISPEFYSGAVQIEDVFLLCCDGVYRDVDEELLRSSMRNMLYASEEVMSTTCLDIARAAEKAGSNDNISLVCFTQAELVRPSHDAGEVAYDDETTSLLGTGTPDDSGTGVLDAKADDDTTVHLPGGISEAPDDDATGVLDGTQVSDGVAT